MNDFYFNNLNTINSSAQHLFESIHSPVLTKCMLFITDIGGPGSIALYCLVLIMTMWLHQKYTHLVQFIVTISVSAFAAVGIKELVKMPRPDNGLISEIGYSFASAHALIATVFFTLLIYSYKNHFTNIYVRSLYVSSLTGAVVLIGLSRVYLGVHYMTDVLAGFLVGLIIAAISILIHERHFG